MTSATQMILALIVALIILIYLLVKSRLNPFVSLIIGALLTGILGGMDPMKVIDAIKTGFGNTLANLGILILFGVMIGKVLEVSGATQALGKSFVKALGKGHEIVAMILTGFVTSLAIFCVPAFIMLFPLAKDISKRTGISIYALGIALAGGLLWSHTLVPPATGPIGGAGIFQADIAKMMLFGFLIGIPMAVFLAFYSRWIGKKFPEIAEDQGEVIENEDDHQKLPSPFLAAMPILIPVILILTSSGVAKIQGASLIKSIFTTIGTPVVAMGLGLLFGIYTLLRGIDRKKVSGALDAGIESGAKIFVLIAAGGALGNVVNQSGVGQVIAEGVSRAGLPAILVPFIIATLLRVIQGSGSVAILTTASITAPIMQTLGIDPVLATLAACVGSMFFSYYNDSYFWAITTSIGAKDPKHQMLSWSVPTTVCWVIGGTEIFLLSLFI
ncbi:GntP family permease [Sporolactobacillus terrae]|uniref:GntP family permease n=1 Tax=Sporolactobacillus terrae TaxID=269673 RepID=UPI00048EFA74|nr:SLC13 family permease [Sporolactobacillus terrae]